MNNEIKCPNCGEVFKIDERNYESIVSQIKNHILSEEKSQIENEYKEKLQKELELNSQKIINSTSADINKVNNLLNEKILEINKLNGIIDNLNVEKELAVSKAVADKDNQISKLMIDNKSLKEVYENKIKDKDEMISYYKDLKAKASTKMIGESLEQHCSNEFNSIRSTAFKYSYFEKDNKVSSSGSKGDFIFRDYENEDDLNNMKNDYISIMFEMKNESDDTVKKHKNEDFFKELDKDRNEKKCEYAVLVSLLEPESELYNTGIVDVSYKYPKMYVIRPQFFIPIITILRNAALNSIGYKKELIIAKSQDLDLENFENNMDAFKDAFSKKYNLASKQFNEAIEQIDKSIAQLNKVKDALISSGNNLRLANDKAQDLSIKKLTKNAPSLRKQFDDLKK